MQSSVLPVSRVAKAPSSSAVETTSDSGRGRLVRKTAVELVADEVRNRILSGQLAPGSALRQEALSEELGVSRIPLREAMRLLSAEGLVDLIPHRGAFVSMLSKDEVQEFFDLRMRLEPWLMHEAAMRITDAELQRAETLVQQMDTIGPEAWGRLNWELHETLYRAAGRPAALAIVRALHEKSERYFRFQVVNAPIRQQSHEEHMALVELCRHRQADKAEALLEHHIGEAAEQILSIVSKLVEEDRTVSAA